MELVEFRHSKYFEFVVARLKLSNNTNYSLNELSSFDALNPKLLINIINAFDDDWYHSNEYFEDFTTNEILEYLFSTHAYYRESVLPSIERLILHLQKQNYGNPMVREFRNCYAAFKKEFMHHLAQEERIVFPYIKLLQKSNMHLLAQLQQVDVISLLAHDHDPTESHPFFAWARGLRRLNLAGIHDILKLEIIVNKFTRDLKIHAFIEEEVLYFKCAELLSTKKT